MGGSTDARKSIEKRHDGLINEAIGILLYGDPEDMEWYEREDKFCDTDMDTDDFFFNRENYETAARFCDGCPVQAECLAGQLVHEWQHGYAHTRNGVYGGITPRRRIYMWAIVRERAKDHPMWRYSGNPKGVSLSTQDLQIKTDLGRATGDAQKLSFDNRNEHSDQLIWLTEEDRGRFKGRFSSAAAVTHVDPAASDS